MQRSRIVVVALLLVIALGLGVLTGIVLPRLVSRAAPPVIYNTATILKQVQSLSQLVTVKYVLEKVVILEDVKWYGESRVLLVAHGVVKAGVDLGQLKPEDVEVGLKKITIALPTARITDVYLDEQKTRVIERTTGVLRTFDKDFEQNARRQAIDDIRRGAFQSGIIQDANERARQQLVSLFQQLGYAEVEVRTK
ncbi:MAG: DUF4230 domain-containing protein [Verrucomicrobia bacterium]|nr:DUF4230 domain-containing protein [Verrucomicrobiota bacterium]